MPEAPRFSAGKLNFNLFFGEWCEVLQWMCCLLRERRPAAVFFVFCLCFVLQSAVANANLTFKSRVVRTELMFQEGKTPVPVSAKLLSELFTLSNFSVEIVIWCFQLFSSACILIPSTFYLCEHCKSKGILTKLASCGTCSSVMISF